MQPSVALAGSVMMAMAGGVPLTAQSVHPCDLPPSSGATVTAGPVPLGWCHDGLGTDGTPVPVSDWMLYADDVRTPVTNATTDGIANANGERFYTASVTFPQGNFQVRVAGINGAGEGPTTSPFSLTCTPTMTPPSAPTSVRVS